MTYKIAIVDDENEPAAHLEACLKRYETEHDVSFSIQKYESAQRFLRAYNGGIDLIFMDIQMPEQDGMALSKRLREKRDATLLIFVTNMVQYALEGYQVDAMDFLVKPVNYYRLESTVTKAINILKDKKGVKITIRTKETNYFVESSSIYYIETLMHHTIFHTESGTYDAVGSLKKLEEDLAGQHFARCNNGYLVNLQYVKAVDGEDVLVGKERLKISRTRRKQFLIELSEFLGEQ